MITNIPIAWDAFRVSNSADATNGTEVFHPTQRKAVLFISQLQHLVGIGLLEPISKLLRVTGVPENSSI